ncbi:Defective-in-cullin neddylation protein [Cynara cardunculus var. scolymus]|uniref:Defective in cullin neddylation protein n=1 Tax=Cynara cardunculus var. scolymus TaxID=59895 RepID=A0A103XN82_CYNCS|nr:Defective-in-cullin neddylation protein [Cynara cardunculus var. scolymus]
MPRASKRKSDPVRSSEPAPKRATAKEVERIDNFFASYANTSIGMIDPEGVEKLCSDLRVEHTDVRILMLAWKMNAKKQGYFTQVCNRFPGSRIPGFIRKIRLAVRLAASLDFAKLIRIKLVSEHRSCTCDFVHTTMTKVQDLEAELTQQKAAADQFRADTTKRFENLEATMESLRIETEKRHAEMMKVMLQQFQALKSPPPPTAAMPSPIYTDCTTRPIMQQSNLIFDENGAPLPPWHATSTTKELNKPVGTQEIPFSESGTFSFSETDKPFGSGYGRGSAPSGERVLVPGSDYRLRHSEEVVFLSKDDEALLGKLNAFWAFFGLIKEDNRDEWRTGLKSLHADTLKKLKKELPELEKEVAKQNNFEDFYCYSFRYCLTEDKQKSLDIESVCMLLDLVLGRQFPLQIQKEYKVINMDQWTNFFRFCQEIEFPDLQNYDACQAWPLILDNFVDWLREKLTAA